MLKPFINYFGGKYRISMMYEPPKYNTIIEPFAGGAGYSLRYYQQDVILYDKDEVIVDMWQYLISASRNDIMCLPVDFEHVDELNVPSGAKTLIGFCLNTGSSRPCKTRSLWGHKYKDGCQFWGEKRRERISNQVEKIKHWKCTHVSNYSEIENTYATWFIDPPYQDKGYGYKYGSKDIDFNHLAEWCLSRSGQVTVCEQSGAEWLPFNNQRSVKSNHKTERSNEVWYYREG